MFLQTLGAYKIPAVIERRRKELLDKLTLIQGGTLKDVPVVDGTPPATDNKTTTSEKSKGVEGGGTVKDKGESSESSSTASSTVTSPCHGKSIKRRDSAVVSSLIKDYETIHHSAKKEEVSETPKRFVTLKRVAKPTDFPASADKDSDEDKPKEEEKKVEGKDQKDNIAADNKVEVMVTLDVADAAKERAGSIISGGEESNEEDEEEDKKKKKKGKKSGGFGLKMKGFRRREKSPVPERKNRPVSAETTPPPDTEKKEEEDLDKQEESGAAEEAEKVQEEEEGVRISGDLGKMKKKMGLGKSAKHVHVKVCETTMMIGDKEELDLAKCSVDMTDIGFDLSHPHHKALLMFKVDGDEELRENRHMT